MGWGSRDAIKGLFSSGYLAHFAVLYFLIVYKGLVEVQMQVQTLHVLSLFSFYLEHGHWQPNNILQFYSFSKFKHFKGEKEKV